MKTCVILVGLALPACAATVVFEQPVLDKWMYGAVSGTFGGTRATAPVFGYPDTAGDEDRMGQMLVAFLTNGSIASGLGASNYNITRVTMSAFNFSSTWA